MDEPSYSAEESDLSAVPDTDRASSTAATAVAEDGAPDTGVTEVPGDATAAKFTLSFIATCSGESVTFNAAGTAVVRASAAHCRRRNGTQTGFVSWSGFCTGDIANCNGVLRCGRC